MARVFLFIGWMTIHSFFLLSNEPEIFTRRIYANLAIKDYETACHEGQLARQYYEDCKLIWEASIKAEAKACHEKEMIALWTQYLKKFPEEKDNRELLESMAWCIVDQGTQSPIPSIRATATLGAYLSRDSKGVNVLLKALHDPNSFVRALAIQLASEMKDAPLCKGIWEAFLNETVWKVRMEAIEAMGALEIKEAVPHLLKLISNENNHHEERTAAINSLVSLSNKLERKELEKLATSNRAGFRLLACQLIIHFNEKENYNLLLPLIHDHCAEVRAAALQTLGLLREQTIGEKQVASLAEPLVKDPDPHAAVAAAWLLTLNQPEKGQEAFRTLLTDPLLQVRLLAAAALAATGKYGMPLTGEMFNASSERFVRMNLALGLIGQKENTQRACECLYSGLMQDNERWMWDEQGLFQVLAPSQLKFDDLIPNYPEAQNQLVRLDILNVLAVNQYPLTQQAVKAFLQKRTWGVTGIASALLLTEGDEMALDIVEGLLSDSDKKVRVQAALMLAMWGRGENVIHLLQQEYHQADRELKERILEGIARVGAQSSLTFLVERLKESHQSLRIMAASALLICLYH